MSTHWARATESEVATNESETVSQHRPHLLLVQKNGKESTYTRKTIPELGKKLRKFVKNQYNNPFDVILDGCLVVDETSLKDLVNDSIQEILRKIKLNCVMAINGLKFIFTEI